MLKLSDNFAPLSLLLRMRFRKCSSCVSRHNKQQRSSNHRPANFPVHQTRSQLSSPDQLPPRNNESEQPSSKLCAPPAQTLTTSANQRYATMMKEYDCVSYAVNRFLEPITECASASDDKDRYYTCSGPRD